MMTDDIPIWTKRDYIINGYRNKKNIRECLISIFKVHNETLNIWTHLISLIIFLYLLVKDIINYNKNYNIIWGKCDINDINDIIKYENILYYDEHILLLSYDLITITTFSISTLYHTFIPNSYNNYIMLLKLDLLTIILTICSSNYIIMYYWFWCIDNYLKAYKIISYIYFSGGIILLYNLDILKKYNYIMVYFSSYNLGIIIGYIYINYYYKGYVENYIVYNFSHPLIFYLLGFIIYITKIPEKLLFDYTDYIGNSHQIWHLLSSIASYLFREEILKNTIYRNNNYLC